MVCADALDCLGEFGLGVLDDVTFIKDAKVPVKFLQGGNLVTDDLIRRYDNVVPSQLWHEPLTFPSVPDKHDRLQIIGVLEDLVVPMPSQGRRTNDE